MNNKFLLLLLLFFVLFLSPFVFSNNISCSNLGDVGNTFVENDKICVCISTEDNLVTKYCNYNVDSLENNQLSSFKDDLNIIDINCNSNDLNQINLDLDKLKKNTLELTLLNNAVVEKKEILKAYLKDYVVCKETATGLRNNNDNSNFNDDYSNNSDKNNSDLNDDSSENYLVDDELVNSVENLVLTTNSIISDRPILECVEHKNKIESVKGELKNLIINIKSEKNANKENLIQIKNLLDKKELILKKCVVLEPKFNCQEDILNLKNKKSDFAQKLQDVKKNIAAADQNSSDYLELKNKFRNLNIEYNGLEQKITVLSKNCVLNSNSKDLLGCDEKKNALEYIDELKKELNDTNDVDLIYALKTKLEFLQNKYDAISCSVSENDYEVIDCIQHLKVADNLTMDEITNICKNPKNIEYQKRLTYVDKLNSEIKVKEQKLNALNSKITSVEQKLNSLKDRDAKLALIIKNKTDILNDTTLKIENSISELKKRIELLDISNMKSDLKESNIKALNERIASLEQIKDNLSLVSDGADLKEVINSAREDDILSKKERNNSILLSEIDSIDTMVLDKYFLDNMDYNLLKSKLADIKLKAQNIDLNSDDFDLIKNELEQFKQTLKEYYKGGNN